MAPRPHAFRRDEGSNLRAALIVQGVSSRKCRDLQKLSERLGDTIPGWHHDAFTLNTLTQAGPPREYLRRGSTT